MRQLKGIIPPMVTPLSGQDTLDTNGLESLIEHILSADVNGLFVLGSSGETASISAALQRSVMQLSIRQVAGRVPVLVGITNTCLGDCLSMAYHAADQGATAVVMSAPYYFPISQEDLLAFALKVAHASPLPLYLYNMPSCTKIEFKPDTVEKLADCRNIIGIKDSSGDMIYLHRLIELTARLRPDWSVLVGPEELLAEAVIMGGHGGVCGGANMFPSLYQALYEAAEKKEMETVQQLHKLVLDVSRAVYNGSYLPGVKYALGCLNICSDYIAEPQHAPAPDRQQEIAEFLNTFKWQKSVSLSVTNRRKISAR